MNAKQDDSIVKDNGLDDICKVDHRSSGSAKVMGKTQADAKNNK